MPIINITVADKRATLQGSPMIVCDNTDYSVKFTFDAGWGANTAKTARFAWVADGKRQHKDVIFTGDTVAVPALVDTWEVYVGVFEGDLSTTTPARIHVERSIRSHSGQPAEETPGQYDHIMVLFQSAVDNQAQAEENARTAQDAAQRAENAAVNVEAIVAGNEAYTKQENDSRDAPAIVESATGAAIVVHDAADRPLRSLVLHGKTTQAGTPTPDVPVDLVSLSGTLGVKVCGKNMLHYPYSEGSMTRKGITFTVNDDGTIKATGTSAGAYILLVTKAEKQVYLSAGKTYTFSGVPAGGGMGTYYAYVATDDETFFDTGTGVTLTPKNSGYVSVTAVIKEGVTVNGLKFKPQLELAGAASGFEPYQARLLSYELPDKFSAGTLDCLTGVLNYGTIIDLETDEWGPGRGSSGWLDGFESVGKETIAFHHHLGGEKDNYYPATLCSHFPAAAKWADIVSATTEMAYRGNASGLAYAAVRIKRSRLVEYGFIDDGTGETAVAAFTAWLEAQAAAGTPVQFVGEIENTAQLVGAVSANAYKLTTTVHNDAGLDMIMDYVADTEAFIRNGTPPGPDENEDQDGTGLSKTASNALIKLLKNAVYVTGDMYPELTTLADELGVEIPANPVTATAIVLSSSTLSFTSEDPKTLTATLYPANATDTVAWVTSDPAVAVVSGGVVTPIAKGNCTITATAGSVSAKCSVTVAIEAAPLYRLPDVTRSFSGGTDFLETTSENHIKITTVGAYAVGISNCDTYADGYGKNKGCNPSTTWFTIPAGSTCELYALNGTGSGDITAYGGGAIKFIKPNGNWDGTLIDSNFYLSGAEIIAGTHKTITLDADTAVAAIASVTYSVGTIECDLRLYVDGVRYI